MELIWDKNNFSEALKNHVGFVDADIRFERMKSALFAATSEIIDLIGEDNYEVVFGKVKDTNFNSMVEYAILLKALIIYVPTSDIAFTNRGRKLRTDEHDGTPWQWMLDANDKALNNLYYRHLDLLLKYMFKNEIKVNVEKYDFQNLIVNNINVFEKHFNISGSYYLFIKLIPALSECEDLEIAPRLATLKKDDFVGKIKNICEKISVYYALDWGLRRLNISLFPEGVFQESWSTGAKNLKSADKLQYLETAMIFQQDTRKYLIALERMVSKLQNENQENSNTISLDNGIDYNDNFIDT